MGQEKIVGKSLIRKVLHGILPWADTAVEKSARGTKTASSSFLARTGATLAPYITGGIASLGGRWS
jgi:hypothetical protein